MQDLIVRNTVDENGVPAGGFVSSQVGGGPVLHVQWQDGPLVQNGDRAEPNGCFVETVIEAAASRLRFYQTTKFQCGANNEALGHLEAALIALRERTADREQRGVEGTSEV